MVLVLVIVVLLVAYELGWIAYNLWFSPLANIPGPFFARISNLWLTYQYDILRETQLTTVICVRRPGTCSWSLRRNMVSRLCEGS